MQKENKEANEVKEIDDANIVEIATEESKAVEKLPEESKPCVGLCYTMKLAKQQAQRKIGKVKQ